MKELLRILAFLFALILCGVALLTGGCSILFTPALWGNGEFEGPGLLPIWGTGLGIAAVCITIAVLIFRRLRRPALPSATTFAAGEAPDAPMDQAKAEAPDKNRGP